MSTQKNVPEGITSRDQDSHSILDEPEAHLAQVGTLPDTVHTNEYDTIRFLLPGTADHTRLTF